MQLQQDEIIEMARESGLPHWYEDDTLVNESRVIKFAKLIAAKEREACAKVCEEVGEHPSLTPQHCAESIRSRGQT